ncbi:MAG: hypothetical protein E7618_00895 [Ruminococcaceae bacterium]|nr:hypothetical protein [Oscillospiraceae bacterium]
MKDKKTLSLPLAPILTGILLALLVFSVALMQTILLYGERKTSDSAITAALILACLGILIYAAIEWFFQTRYPRSALFSLTYFLCFAILAAVFFSFVTTADLATVFDGGNADEAMAVLLAVSFRLCVVNAVAMLLRIGMEIVIFIRHPVA